MAATGSPPRVQRRQLVARRAAAEPGAARFDHGGFERDRASLVDPERTPHEPGDSNATEDPPLEEPGQRRVFPGLADDHATNRVVAGLDGASVRPILMEGAARGPREEAVPSFARELVSSELQAHARLTVAA